MIVTTSTKQIANLIPKPIDNRSVIDRLRELNDPEQVLSYLEEIRLKLGLDEVTFKNQFKYMWDLWARPSQLEPDADWRTWAVLTGRGGGKTRLAVEWLKQRIAKGEAKRIAIVGPTSSAINRVLIYGDSGLMSVYAEKDRPKFTSTNRTIEWFNEDGTVKALAETFAAETPDRLRGPQFDTAIVDELVAFKYPQLTWDMLQMTLRLGNPKVVLTTTPQPLKTLLDILKSPYTYTTTGTTFENAANLPKEFREQIIDKYQNTRLGRQELYGEILENVDGALWNMENIERYRIDLDENNNYVNYKKERVVLPDFKSIVLAVDPAVSNKATSAETGMCVAAFGVNQHFYIIHLDSHKDAPEAWAQRAINLMKTFECDKLVAEVNQGGDLVKANIKIVDPLQFVHDVRATRGKIIRAEPIANLYTQGKVHHIGRFSEGEQQMCSFSPLQNPTGYLDQIDALVWAMTKLVEDYQRSGASKPLVGGIRNQLLNYRVR